jgi:hypothetical protein
MDEPPKYSELAAKAGISPSYAHEIVNGRTPQRPLAIHIFRTTGWRHAILDGLSDEDIATLERIDPWSAKAAA